MKLAFTPYLKHLKIKTMKNYQSIKDIVDRIEMSEYECEAGFLKMNTAFKRLKNISELNYQPKFQLNEKVIYCQKEYYIRGMMTKSSSHPYPEVEYILSIKYNSESTSNETNITWVNEMEIMTLEEWRAMEIDIAKKILIKNGITIL